ncbi:glycosyl transferase family 1 [Sulfobacillus thermotolerans]|uniref:Glycosyl transferase family 1 n=1 Tax=Sulfobacillus thermotolerans TaxID=338644 RepID=A0ABM6RUL1_9FIRM|nr:glycosyl transferase family 1 [Sulfobacillus thermotolerans]
MRIALLADAGSVHTQRWIQGLQEQGHRVVTWSQRSGPVGDIRRLPPPRRGRLDTPAAVWQIRKQVMAFQPDVVHAHYLSHYGLLGAAAHLVPLVVSVWGADIECFPHSRGWLTRSLVQWILQRADAITVSSQYLQKVTQQYTAKPIAIIPFGIDLNRFRPQAPNTGPLRFIINKALEPVYGIDIIFEALRHVQGPWQGRVLGTGSQEQRLRQMAHDASWDDRLQWRGIVPASRLPEELAWADVGLYASRRESFGVAPLEMMALGRTAIAHRIGGLGEVIDDHVNGLLVDPQVPGLWQQVLQQAVKDPDAIRLLGAQGPAWVAKRYDFAHNLGQIQELYRQVQRKAG